MGKRGTWLHRIALRNVASPGGQRRSMGKLDIETPVIDQVHRMRRLACSALARRRPAVKHTSAYRRATGWHSLGSEQTVGPIANGRADVTTEGIGDLATTAKHSATPARIDLGDWSLDSDRGDPDIRDTMNSAPPIVVALRGDGLASSEG